MASRYLVALALVVLTTAAHAQPWPNCPFTGTQPAATGGKATRCLDASRVACCSDCADVSVGLAMVSTNVSKILQLISPVLLPALKGEDISFCTAVYPSATCQDNLEQLGCAITCNPDAGNYINVTYNTREFKMCSEFAGKVTSSCQYAQITGTTAINNQTFFSDVINPTYMLQALFNSVTGMLGIPTLNVIVVNGTTGCYNGPVTAPARHVCCDDLTPSQSCPNASVNFVANPQWAPFSGQAVDTATCRAMNAFPIAPLAPLPPPPPSPPAPSNLSNALGSSSNYPPPSGAAAVAASLTSLLGVLAASLALLA